MDHVLLEEHVSPPELETVLKFYAPFWPQNDQCSQSVIANKIATSRICRTCPGMRGHVFPPALSSEPPCGPVQDPFWDCFSTPERLRSPLTLFAATTGSTATSVDSTAVEEGAAASPRPTL